MKIGMKLREAITTQGGGVRGIQTACSVLREGLKSGKIKRSDISLREMAQSLIGDNWAAKLKEHNFKLRENSAAVDASGFTAITGQLFVDEVKERYKLATMLGDKLFSVSKVTNGNLGTQKVPWLGDVTEDPQVTQQGQPYPSARFGPQYIELPAPQKFGHIVRVTFEMVFSDLTGQVQDALQSSGKRVGLWVEKQRLRVLSGVTNNHSWNGTTYNTYQTSTPWINKITDFTLDDWTDVNRIEQLFAQMTDPVTGEPIDIEAIQCLTVPTLKYTAKRILWATATRSGDITSGAGHQTVADNPLETDFELMTSKHLRKLLIASTGGDSPGLGLTSAVADTMTYWGDFKRALVWREVFPVQVVQAPPQSPEEFNQDIVQQVKTNVHGAAGVRDPRFLVQAYNASA